MEISLTGMKPIRGGGGVELTDSRGAQDGTCRSDVDSTFRPSH